MSKKREETGAKSNLGGTGMIGGSILIITYRTYSAMVCCSSRGGGVGWGGRLNRVFCRGPTSNRARHN